MILVAGDVGGTKTLIQAVEPGPGGAFTTLDEVRYVSADFGNFTDLLRDFLGRLKGPVASASLGVAGAVVEGVVRGTNLPWVMDARELERELGIARVNLMNDFAATARGVLRLAPQDTVTLQAGQPEEQGAIGILGAGTGLGEAFLTWQDGRYIIVSTEAGHADFGARTDEEIELLRHLRGKFGRVSYERLLSGPGIFNIYEYVRQRGHHPESPMVAGALRGGDPAAVITEYDDRDALCHETLDLFVSIYGAEAGNVALRAVATRGVYLAGGIAPRMVPRFQGARFMEAFEAKGRHTPLMKRIPVYLITNTKVGLLGALSMAEELAR